MASFDSKLDLRVPEWLWEEVNALRALRSQSERVSAVLKLAEYNIHQQTGGPFAALVVRRESGEVVAAGVNLVERSELSSAHAEIVAFSLAQVRFGSYDLAGHDLELISSCEPCAMCTGAVLWSGVRSLVYSATGEDARAIGFDEGDKTEDWADGLRRRGIEVSGPVLREEGRRVFEEYVKLGGTIYNSGQRSRD